ncbi:uncharacterized protein G2W53_033881 [Senna tora]|uniref:Uncharacterized protein n=1 Tax=Senna tora TaxID=362788 RepID=A0A834SZD4_9FABA|nr:uncharacterized protein G2W53_033881 [Senna tora]
MTFHRFRGPFVTSLMSPIPVQFNDSIGIISVDQLQEDELRSLKLWKLVNMDNDDSVWSIGVHGTFHRNPNRWTQSRALINFEVTNIFANKIFKFSSSLLSV